MGQHSSNLGGSSLASPRNKNASQKPARPPEPPKVQKNPNHIIPENKVIHDGVSDMEQARKLLRPVSQELSKIHPDFADIFQYDPEIDFLAGGDVDFSLEESLNFDQSNGENSSQGLSKSSSAIPMTTLQSTNYDARHKPIPNGNAVPNGSPESKAVDDVSSKNHQKTTGALRRTQSMQRESHSGPTKQLTHKRQASCTNGDAGVNSTIVEDPREHLYNITRNQPFSNMMPSTASLPLENSFGLDYSFNLTYAQLAEYRRQKKTSELEEKTGKKLSDLSAEISANNVVPKSPFDRQNIGTKSGPLSVSTGSSETGVCKSKKKRAPPPPGPPPSKNKESNSKSRSEPPVDYDMDDLPAINSNRRNSSASNNMTKYTTATSNANPVLNQSEMHLQHRMSVTKTYIPPPPISIASGSAAAPPPAPPPPPPPAPPLPLLPPASVFSQTSSAAKRHSVKTQPGHKTSTFTFPGQDSLQESKNLARAQLEDIKRLQDALKNPVSKNAEIDEKTRDCADASFGSVGDIITEDAIDHVVIEDNNNENAGKEKSESTSEKVGEQVEDKTEVSQVTEKSNEREDVTENSTGKPATKKMSSLLQHDIVLAAQARGGKLVKTRPPPVLEKPLDAAEVFRLELAKAASEREERRKSVLTNVSSSDDLELQSSNSQNNSRPTSPHAVEVSNTELRETDGEMDANGNVNTATCQSKQPCDGLSTPEKEQNQFMQDVSQAKTELDAEFLATDFDKRSHQPSIHSEDMSISSSSSQRVFSSNWTPEDDLDSDDDILVEDKALTSQSFHSEGFKSSIIPSKIKDLKSGEKKKKRQSKKRAVGELIPEGKKMESVRKLKNSVQTSMRSALGSISRASGKLLKRRKSQDFLDSPDLGYTVPSPGMAQGQGQVYYEGSSWELASSADGSIRRSLSDADMKHNNLYTHEDDSFSDADIGDIDFSTGLNDPDETVRIKEGKESEKPLKLAGIAYISGKGDLIVVSDSDSRENENLNKAKRDVQKSKKDKVRALDSSVDAGFAGEDVIAREIREKERLLDLERQKQHEMEKNFRRLQDLETQERLQRIQTANMRKQITLLQQQQIQQAHAELHNHSLGLSTPSLSNSQFSRGTPLSNSAFMANPPLDFASLPSLTQPIRSSNLGYAQPQQHPTAIQRGIMGQNASLPLLSSNFNASQFTTHSGPIIGGTTFASNVPNLTNQELNYLGEYMRVMGVQPPSSQQQWALLLSTLQIHTPQQMQGFSLHPNPMHSGVQLKGTGPDLSLLFGKRLENTLMDLPTQEIPVRPFSSSRNSGAYDDNVNLNKNISTDMSGVLQAKRSPIITDAPKENIPILNTVSSETSVNAAQNAMQLEPSLNDKEPLDNSSSATHTSIAPTSPEQRIDLLTSSNISPQDTANLNAEETPSTGTTTQPSSSSYSSMAYGPIGFRPVSFSARAAT